MRLKNKNAFGEMEVLERRRSGSLEKFKWAISSRQVVSSRSCGLEIK